MNLFSRTFTNIDKIQLLGVGFVIVWAIDFVTKAYWFGIEKFQFLFFCSTMLFMGGIGFLYRKPKIVAVALGITLVFQIPWLLDIISIIFFGHTSNFSASYVYDLNFWQYIITLRHFFMIPLLLYGLTLFEKPNLKGSYMMSAHTFLLFVVASIVFPPFTEDINYTGSLPHHVIQTGDFVMNKLVLLIITTIVIMMVTYILTKIPFENIRWNKSARIFSGIYALVGIVLSIVGYIRIY